MDLLTNAIESIQVGVQDYKTGTRPRLLSAVRNIHAGILLLYKEALLRESPPDSEDALIKARIEPRRETDGTVTFGSQTHPADGNCGVVLTSRDKAKSLSRKGDIEVQLVSYGQGRAKKGYMAKSTVPAAQAALDAAGLGIGDMKAIKTHNPFAVNDLYLAKEFGLDANDFNNFGSSLIFGHPQAPTGMRLVIELIEELAQTGGGHGLFTGCAAGDTAASVVVKVGS